MRRILVLAAALGLVFSGVVPVGAVSPHDAYDVHVLVSDGSVPADFVDPNLVNAWGLSRTATSPWWIANNETDTSTLHDGAGAPVSLIVVVPGGPTGTVAGTTPGFPISNGTTTARSVFLFDNEAGQILGWNPGVAPTTALVGLDRSSVGASYKGLAIGNNGGTDYLFAADFHNARVDVVGVNSVTGTWEIQDWSGAFVDPGLPAGFAPFGIQNLNGSIFVAYAKQDDEAEDEVAGEGLGYVSRFATDGTFLERVASGGSLNAPWGLAMAPATFGEFSNQLLVGNFGNGHINAFEWTGSFWNPTGHLKTVGHQPVRIDGLWAIAVGSGAAGGRSGPADSLFFSAGPDDETHGAFGTVRLH